MVSSRRIVSYSRLAHNNGSDFSYICWCLCVNLIQVNL